MAPPAGGRDIQAHLSRALVVEALVLGNLPGLASLWPAQYARHVAAQINHPVALISADPDVLTIRGFMPGGHRQAGIGHSQGLEGRAGTNTDPVQSLAGLLALAPRVMIVVSSPEDEHQLLCSQRVSIMTVLTGADDASAVGAYRTIKRLASLTDASRGPGDEIADIRLAFMGSGSERAHAAWDRLSASARNFLDVGVTLGGVVAQLESLASSWTAFEAPHNGAVTTLLERAMALASLRRDQADHHTAEPHTSAPAAPTASIVEQDEPVDDLAEAGCKSGAPAPLSITNLPASLAGPGSPEDRPDMTSRHRGQRQPQTCVGVPVLPGLKALGFVCPGHPGVLLATDDEGRAHALVMVSGTHGVGGATQGATGNPTRSLACDERVQAGVYRLVSVGAWLRANAELLGAISRGRLSEDLAPCLHILTDSPSSVRGLIDSEICVHACGLASSAVDGVVLTRVN